jgi:hypothetical protein
MPKVMAKLSFFAESREIDADEIPGLRGQGIAVEVVSPPGAARADAEERELLAAVAARKAGEKADDATPDSGGDAPGTSAGAAQRSGKPPRTDGTKGDPS